MAKCVLPYHQCLLFHLALQSSADVTHDSEVDSTPLGKQYLKGAYLCGL